MTLSRAPHVAACTALIALLCHACGSSSGSGGAPDQGDTGPTATDTAATDSGPTATDASPKPADSGTTNADTAATDTGPAPTDNNPDPTDAGPDPTDAGPPPTDAGPPPTDAGASCAAPQPANTECKDGTWTCKADTFTPPGSAECLPVTCDAMSKALFGAIDSAVDASNNCEIDNDCEAVDKSTACMGACPVAINQAHKDAFAATLDALDKGICVANDYAKKCGYATPKCLAPNPGCVAGKCVYSKPKDPPPPVGCQAGFFKAYGSDVCEEATCANMATAKANAINVAVAAAQTCTADNQCVIVQTGTQCGGTCGAAVNSAAKDAVTVVVQWVDKNICQANDYPKQCGYATPGCIAPNPGCKAGICVYNK